MPQASDLTLTDRTSASKTFSLLAPAAGYGGVAEFALKEGSYSKLYPTITGSARKNQNSRKSTWKLKIPDVFTDANGEDQVRSTMHITIEVTVPDTLSANTLSNGVAFLESLTAQSLFQDACVEAYPAT